MEDWIGRAEIGNNSFYGQNIERHVFDERPLTHLHQTPLILEVPTYSPYSYTPFGFNPTHQPPGWPPPPSFPPALQAKPPNPWSDHESTSNIYPPMSNSPVHITDYPTPPTYQTPHVPSFGFPPPPQLLPPYIPPTCHPFSLHHIPHSPTELPSTDPPSLFPYPPYHQINHELFAPQSVMYEHSPTHIYSSRSHGDPFETQQQTLLQVLQEQKQIDEDRWKRHNSQLEAILQQVMNLSYSCNNRSDSSHTKSTSSPVNHSLVINRHVEKVESVVKDSTIVCMCESDKVSVGYDVLLSDKISLGKDTEAFDETCVDAILPKIVETHLIVAQNSAPISPAFNVVDEMTQKKLHQDSNAHNADILFGKMSLKALQKNSELICSLTSEIDYEVFAEMSISTESVTCYSNQFDPGGNENMNRDIVGYEEKMVSKDESKDHQFFWYN